MRKKARNSLFISRKVSWYRISEETIMTNLLVLREQLRKFYSKYELYITPFSKFLLALVSVLIINDAIGYMSMLKNIEVVLVLALMCSFLPMNFIVLVAAAVTLAHIYAL